MRKLAAASIAATMVVMGAQNTLSANDGPNLDLANLYVGGTYNRSELRTSSGGFNTIGGFNNFDCAPGTLNNTPLPGFPVACTDQEDVDGFSVFGGIDELFHVTDFISLRLEGEFTQFDGGEVVTGSSPGSPPAPGLIPFSYNTNISDIEAGFANAYIDFAVHDRVKLFLGAGIGASSVDINTTDTVVNGAGGDTNFAYNVGAGARIEVIPSVEVFGGVRFVDLGTTRINLTTVAGGVPAGNYTLDIDTVQARVGLIWNFGHHLANSGFGN